MILTEFINHIRTDLAITSADELTEPEVERSLQRAVLDLSRYIPREKVLDVTLTFEVKGESVSAAAAAGTYVDLANKPIEVKSETVKNTAGTVTYVLDTDYTMDYAGGRITHISGGAIANSQALKVDYRKHAVSIDLAPTAAKSAYKIAKVCYPAGRVPEETLAFSISDDVITVLSGLEAQAKMAAGNHAWVYYLTTHSMPTQDAGGSYPSILDEVLAKGAAAYGLLILSARHQHKSIGDLASSRTALGKLSSVHTDISTVRSSASTTQGLAKIALDRVDAHLANAKQAADKVVTYADLTKAQLDKAWSGAGDPITKARAELDGLAAILTSAESALAKMDSYIATQAKTDLDGAVTFIGAADTDLSSARSEVSSAATALAKVNTHLTDTTNSATQELTEIDAQISAASAALASLATMINTKMEEQVTAAEGVWPDQVKHILDPSTEPSMEFYLNTGDDFINAVNLGSDVARTWMDYARTTLTAGEQWAGKRSDFVELGRLYLGSAGAFASEAGHRINQAQQFIQASQTRVAIANGFIQEAQTRSSLVKDYLSAASVKVSQAEQRVAVARWRLTSAELWSSEAGERLREASTKVEAAKTWIGLADSYVTQANGYLQIGLAYIQEADRRVSIARAYTEEGSGRSQQVSNYIQEASVLIQQAQVYLSESVQYQASSTRAGEVSKSLREEAIIRRDEFWSLLRNAAQMIQVSNIATPLRPVSQ